MPVPITKTAAALLAQEAQVCSSPVALVPTCLSPHRIIGAESSRIRFFQGGTSSHLQMTHIPPSPIH